MMNVEALSLSVVKAAKNFVAAQPMKDVSPFTIGRNLRRIGIVPGQEAGERVKAGWQFEDIEMRKEMAWLKGKVTL